MNDSLVLIVHTKQEFSGTLLRRTYLSGWNPKKGFFEENAPGEIPQIKEVPRINTDLEHPDYALRTQAEQEYFIVNFDPASLIAMDYPVSVTPYRIWDTAAFNGAYSVTSNITGFMPFELYDSPFPTGKESDGMTGMQLDFYTRIDPVYLERLQPLARSITAGIPGYYDQILAISSFLKDGDYRYSLKPGIAPDGDQLSYFLFDTKKGYCTYFAFSMTLMLRSLGIPARVAAGFFIQPDSGALNYFPVRANMAHAWVEVFFPRYGWISFDPTSTNLAQGEDLQLSNTPGGDEFLRLLDEILENRNLLRQATTTPESNSLQASLVMIWKSILAQIRKTGIQLFALLLLAGFTGSRVFRALVIRFSRNPRKVILILAEDSYRRLSRRGKKRSRSQGRKEFVDSIGSQDLRELFILEQKARFSPECTTEDAELARLFAGKLNRRKGHPGKKTVLLLLIVFSRVFGFFGLQQATAQNPASPDPIQSVLTEAEDAINAENWETAISVLAGGSEQFPLAPQIPLTLGKLYLDKKLYSPAFAEFKKALALGIDSPDVYSLLSDTASYLNRDEEALSYLKTYLSLSPDDLFGWSNFGWLCYKTNRLDEGIQALHGITERLGPDSNLYVGLGNLYTAAFNYLDAKKYYTLAIRIAQEHNQAYLLSVYYYNRSILEEVFYNFQDAYDDTEFSLEASPRSSGFLMQGELELRKLNYQEALSRYLKAFSLDSTPLATLGLADTLIQAGYPEQAWQYIGSTKTQGDLSWIANYGTTTDQYQADLNKIKRDIYNFRLQQEKRQVIHNFSTWLKHVQRLCIYSLKHWYHDALFRIQNKKVAQYYEESEKQYNAMTGQGLYINSFYFLAFDRWKNTAEPYLSRAAHIESSFIPAARPSYTLEKGILSRNIALIDEAIVNLDPEWERQYLSRALAEHLALLKNRPFQERYPYLEKLLLLNPSNFINSNIPLPVCLDSDRSAVPLSARQKHTLHASLRQAGFPSDTNSPFVFLIDMNSDSCTVSLFNRNNNRTFYTQVFHIGADSPQDFPLIINSFTTRLFRTDLHLGE